MREDDYWMLASGKSLIYNFAHCGNEKVMIVNNRHSGLLRLYEMLDLQVFNKGSKEVGAPVWTKHSFRLD